MATVISVEHLSKSYQLGQIGTGRLVDDLRVWWAKMRGRPNPFLRIGQTDHGNRDGETIWALKDVSLSVERGEVLGIIGKNGAGKSTLLKILSRITAPTSGKVKVKGRVASLLEVGTGFHPELTGRENIYLNGAILGMTRNEIQRKFDEIVAFAEIEEFVDTPVKRYSSGMYVRLAFAVAAHLEPEILIVDEVLAVGDAEFQRKCLGKMGEVAREGRTVLFVSHNMAAVEQLCRIGILLSEGQLISVGPVLDTIGAYLSRGADLVEGTGPILGLHNSRAVQLHSFRILDGSGNPIESARVGDSLAFQMGLTVGAAIPGARISLGINNHQNLRIATLHSEVSGYPLSLNQGSNLITCRIPSFNLVEGAYRLDVKIYSGRDPILFSQNFYQFTIHPGNFYGSGKLPDPSWAGVCHLVQEWEAQPENA